MKISVRQLVEVSLLVALAYVLDLVAKVYSGWFWAYGGSISLSLVPLAILGYRQGWKIGVIGGFLLGIVKLLIDPYILHPIQVLFDYPLPFAALGLVGIWQKNVNSESGAKQGFYIWLSTLVASLVRLACHVYSGYVFFGSYAPVGMHPLIYSMTYNFPYVALSWFLSAFVLVVIYRRYRGVVNSS